MCNHDQTPTEEQCDIVDNDCDGFRDEGCPCLPGEVMLCEVQKDACAEYYAVCTETYKWSPCIPKPGSEDPACGEETDASSPEDTVAASEDSLTDTSSGEETPATVTNSERPMNNQPVEQEATTPKKVVIIQEEPAGCQNKGASPPFGMLTPLFILGLIYASRSASARP